MDQAASALAVELARCNYWMKSAELTNRPLFSAMVEFTPIRKPHPRSILFAIVSFIAAWLIHAEHYFSFRSLPNEDALRAGLIAAFVALLICSAVAHLIWTLSGSRRIGTLLNLASALLICWSLAILAALR